MDHSLPAQRTKRVLERDELYKGLRSKAVVKSRVVFSYPRIMFWFSICECMQWIGNIQMESKHETTRQWMHRFVEVFWPCGSRNAQVFQPIRGQNRAIMTNERASSDNIMTGMWQTNSEDDTGLTIDPAQLLTPDTRLHTPAHTSSLHCIVCHMCRIWNVIRRNKSSGLWHTAGPKKQTYVVPGQLQKQPTSKSTFRACIEVLDVSVLH